METEQIELTGTRSQISKRRKQLSQSGQIVKAFKIHLTDNGQYTQALIIIKSDNLFDNE